MNFQKQNTDVIHPSCLYSLLTLYSCFRILPKFLSCQSILLSILSNHALIKYDTTDILFIQGTLEKIIPKRAKKLHALKFTSQNMNEV